jgi:flagellar L-ring protein precursor FlgH
MLSRVIASTTIALSSAAVAQVTSPAAHLPEALPSTADVMRRTNGSLMKAAYLAAPSGAAVTPDGKASLAATSFYAVAEPQPRTLKKHDLITIIVREESTFSSDGSLEAKRQADIEAKLEEFVTLKLNNWALYGGGAGANPPSIKASGTRNASNEGTVDRSDSLTLRVGAEVVDVKPNGTVVLQARKRIKTDDEVQTLILSGTCRAQDVTADNSILSTQLHDLDVTKTHTGAVRDATKRGLLHKLLDAANPF